MHNDNLIDLINEYRRESNDYNFNKIIRKLTPLINKYLKKIPSNSKDDIKQELLIVIFKKINEANICYSILSESLFTIDNLKLLKINGYSIDSFDKYFKNKYILRFIKEYGMSNFEKTFTNKDIRKDFIEKFAKEGAKNQFYNLLKLSFNSIVANYYRERKKHNNDLFLNNYNEMNVEYLNIVKDSEDNNISKINWKVFEKIDKEFLFKCFNNERVLTQKEIAKELNITQQAISKKFKKIRNKYKEKIKI